MMHYLQKVRHYLGCFYKQENVEKSIIRKWVDFYKKYGESSLFLRKNLSYSIDFKLNVLNERGRTSFGK